MKKVFLALLLGASAVMADVGGKDDLLNIATAGKAIGASYEMNKEDMQKADGGYYYINSYGSLYYSSYSSRVTNFNTYSSYYSNPSSSSYRGTSNSYIYARAFWGGY
jgi:hypothetical protein